MKTIFKYQLGFDEKQYVSLPKDAKILTVQVQKNNPCLWTLVDTENEIEKRRIEIYGAGHEIPNDGMERKYISTSQMYDGDFVFHVFEYTGFVNSK
jgi:hypothetical protein